MRAAAGRGARATPCHTARQGAGGRAEAARGWSGPRAVKRGSGSLHRARAPRAAHCCASRLAPPRRAAGRAEQEGAGCWEGRAGDTRGSRAYLGRGEGGIERVRAER